MLINTNQKQDEFEVLEIDNTEVRKLQVQKLKRLKRTETTKMLNLFKKSIEAAASDSSINLFAGKCSMR